jgi:hypothetical protein
LSACPDSCAAPSASAGAATGGGRPVRPLTRATPSFAICRSHQLSFSGNASTDRYIPGTSPGPSSSAPSAYRIASSIGTGNEVKLALPKEKGHHPATVVILCCATRQGKAPVWEGLWLGLRVLIGRCCRQQKHSGAAPLAPSRALAVRCSGSSCCPDSSAPHTCAADMHFLSLHTCSWQGMRRRM